MLYFFGAMHSADANVRSFLEKAVVAFTPRSAGVKPNLRQKKLWRQQMPNLVRKRATVAAAPQPAGIEGKKGKSPKPNRKRGDRYSTMPPCALLLYELAIKADNEESCSFVPKPLRLLYSSSCFFEWGGETLFEGSGFFSLHVRSSSFPPIRISP